MKILTISQYSRILGIHPQTLRKLERNGVSPHVKPFRTHGNHRRYKTEDNTDGVVVGYARVSCQDQKGRSSPPGLPNWWSTQRIYGCIRHRQRAKLPQVRSTQLVKALLTGQGQGVGPYLPGQVAAVWQRDHIPCLQADGDKGDNTAGGSCKGARPVFCEDVISIITVFSAKLYGARSHKNRKDKAKTQVCATLPATA